MARTEYGDWKSVHHGTDYLGIIGKFETQSEKGFKWKFCGNIESDQVAARLHKAMEKRCMGKCHLNDQMVATQWIKNRELSFF